MNKDEYVPTTTPIRRANEKPLMISPPVANKTMITLQKIKTPEDLEEMVQTGGGHATASGSSPVM